MWFNLEITLVVIQRGFMLCTDVIHKNYRSIAKEKMHFTLLSPGISNYSIS